MFRLLVLTFVTAACLCAQETVYTLRVDVPLVTVDVRVTDPQGRTVDSLSERDFQIFENGIPQKIHYFSPVSSPYNVLLLFDRSGSTQHKWGFMQRAVAGFIANLRSQDRIALAGFDSEFELLSRWTGSRQDAGGAIGALVRPRSAGGTAFYSALDRAVRREFRSIRTGRRAVVVFTDGRDTSLYLEILAHNRMVEETGSRAFRKTLESVVQAGIPVYFVALNTDRNFEPGAESGDEYRNLQKIFPGSTIPQAYLAEVRRRMEQLSERSGGSMLFPTQIEDIVPLYERMGRELGTSYSLGYLPAGVQKRDP